MLLHDVVTTSGVVAATRSRKAKVAAIADLLGRAEADETEIVTAYVGGTLLQRRTGLGWRSVSALPSPADEPSLGLREVDAAFTTISALAGAGSQAARVAAVAELFGRATADEQVWLRGVVTGEVRQGALDALVQEGLAAAA
ncbi:MAG: ATP-dependent DNA ligase, partial [Nocardioides sp.]